MSSEATSNVVRELRNEIRCRFRASQRRSVSCLVVSRMNSKRVTRNDTDCRCNALTRHRMSLLSSRTTLNVVSDDIRQHPDCGKWVKHEFKMSYPQGVWNDFHMSFTAFGGVPSTKPEMMIKVALCVCLMFTGVFRPLGGGRLVSRFIHVWV